MDSSDEKDFQDKIDLTVTPLDDITLQVDASVLIAGRRRAGKTVMAVHLLYLLTNKFCYQNIILFSNTHKIEDNGAFEFIDRRNVFKGDDMDEMLPKLMAYQEKEKLKSKGKDPSKRKYMIIVFDDLNLNKRSKALDLLFSMGRHYYICVIVLVQYTRIVITNIIRTNIDILLMSDQNDSGMEAMFQCINTAMRKKDFYKFIRDNTINNQFVMYNIFYKPVKLMVVKGKFIEITKQAKQIVQEGGQKKEKRGGKEVEREGCTSEEEGEVE